MVRAAVCKILLEAVRLKQEQRTKPLRNIEEQAKTYESTDKYHAYLLTQREVKETDSALKLAKGMVNVGVEPTALAYQCIR